MLYVFVYAAFVEIIFFFLDKIAERTQYHLEDTQHFSQILQT